MSYVRTGVERLAADPGLLHGDRIGLITNPTGVLSDLTPGAGALRAAGVPLTALFGPEHGIRGTAQAGFSEREEIDPSTGLPVFDTYDKDGSALDALVASSGVDTLVFDISDIGTRFYTYIWTMYDLIASAARLGLRFAVLDRPNPIGGTIAEGPLLDPAYAGSVGRAAIPVRHGLTAGELALLVNRSFGADLRVVGAEGWRRDLPFEATGLPWVMPSVNMPTPETALVYPGTGLFEGTNLSEGRGTTRPFELIGAPYLDDRFAAGLNGLGLPGVRFRDTWFTPTFHKHAGVAVRGVQLHVHDRETFRPVLTALSMMHLARSLHPDDFAWRDDGESEPYFIDLLWGSDSLRRRLDDGGDPADLCPPPGHPETWLDGGTLLYP
ncbi:exo-beta-N-acetylmuramidase NamZ domain-containing protein [Streptosporangium sp. NPDC087985]|uniref:exo-beta-N-acetylmuramidase NamZ family protein n=1 Tax=Streptosporangium sp. NPDC087985 TaxID=3366196 RepID=UPI0037FA56FD